ncbi:hypothetical protein [Actinomadura physcomitrii]|uniref:hypothetical protein n=1 Tax=Actinomadura physcomitrii TaxID=2650748 RepID=UPI0019217EBE|nr:hypothetical protein [Actinomadura physcomitrii]
MSLTLFVLRAAQVGRLLEEPWRLRPQDGLRVPVPDPPPAPPPGLDAKMNTLLSWGKWGVLICGVAGLFICAGQMAIGRKNRSTFAADGATGIPWVLGGLSLAATAAPIVGVFFK